MHTLKLLSMVTLLAPLCGSLLAGWGCRLLKKRGSQLATIALVAVAFFAALLLCHHALFLGERLNTPLYTWGVSGNLTLTMGILMDNLTAVMALVVTFVSLLVHIYSVGYMAEDESNPRFFAYVSLFTFAMLLLLMANNFFQLFVGWEGVGLVSYLLIGFWFERPAAAAGAMKAFIVNRIGDCGFLLGLAAIYEYFGTLDYFQVFAKLTALSSATLSLLPGTSSMVLTVICILLFIGAMGKSAQVPLHIWLPASMEGPTPISALIHAATMVTAGVFMVARLSPLFGTSPTALSVVLVVGATGALLTGLLAFKENDIKRVIAFSTMSQLGYMMAANGVGAFDVSIFHLLTHACFKALLFLAAGSIIVAMHHEQDLRKMGNLKRYLPLTYGCFLVGALALAAVPPFAGFYSKESIIEAVRQSTLAGGQYAYLCLLLGAFATAFYIFRAFFMAFHTAEKMPQSLRATLKEPHWSMGGVLLLLAVPSMGLGAFLIGPMLFQSPGMLSLSTAMDVHGFQLSHWWPALWAMTAHSVETPAFYLTAFGILLAWWLVMVKPQLRSWIPRHLPWLYRVVQSEYGMNWLSDDVVARGVRRLANVFYLRADAAWLDDGIVNGLGRVLMRCSQQLRQCQSGYVYHYATVMVAGLVIFLFWIFW